MSRYDFRRPIEGHVSALRAALSSIPPNKRLHVIAEALCDLNPTGDDEVLQASCGCFDWNISIDYRSADVRYAEKQSAVESKGANHE